jgi:hypothetical protein
LKGYFPVTRRLPFHHWRPAVVFACALYGLPSNGVSQRGDIQGYAVKWMSYS